MTPTATRWGVYEGQRRLGECSLLGQFDQQRAIEGGLNVEFMATFVDERRAGDGIRQSLHFIDLYEELSAFPDLALAMTTTADILKSNARWRCCSAWRGQNRWFD